MQADVALHVPPSRALSPFGERAEGIERNFWEIKK